MHKALIIIKGASFNNKITSANNNKLKHIASLLIDSNINVYILTGVEYYDQFRNDKIIVSGNYNNIYYFNAGLTIQPTSIFAKLIFRITFYLNIISSITSIKKKSSDVVIILDHNSLLFGFVIKLTSVIIQSKIIFHIDEWFPAHRDASIRFRLNAIIFNYFCFWFSDGAIVISEYLKQKALKANKSLNVYKLPSLANYKVDNSSIVDTTINLHVIKFLYCVSLGYIEDIKKVVEAFSLASSIVGVAKIELRLIVNGSRKEMEYFRGELNRLPDLRIIVLSELPEEVLLMEYESADILIAPLNTDDRSNARFPQKIAEYCAASKPIITTAVGDIPLYFKDRISAFLINEFSVHCLYEKMIEVFNDRSNLKNIGDAAYKIGLKNFDCKANRKSFLSFISGMFS
ncbi:RfaG Glycosyltransferase [Methylophilaceae bacterium]